MRFIANTHLVLTFRNNRIQSTYNTDNLERKRIFKNHPYNARHLNFPPPEAVKQQQHIQETINLRFTFGFHCCNCRRISIWQMVYAPAADDTKQQYPFFLKRSFGDLRLLMHYKRVQD